MTGGAGVTYLLPMPRIGQEILTGWTRLGAYVASAWLIGVAVNLVLAGYFDVAVRDVVMAFAAFTLARLTEVRLESAARELSAVAVQPRRQVTA